MTETNLDFCQTEGTRFDRTWIDRIGDDSHDMWLYSSLFPARFHGAVVMRDPYIAKLRHFLTSKECDKILEVAEGKYGKSTILIDGTLTYTKRRTSQTATITENGGKDGPYSVEIEDIFRRVCILIGCLRSQIEGLMVVKYEEGEEFKDHWDYFDLEKDAEVLNREGGQRIGTFFIWLNDLEEEDGGATVFPRIGLKCIPEKGSALFWWNQYGDQLLEDTEHRGAPVLKGTKYGLNVWIRYPGW